MKTKWWLVFFLLFAVVGIVNMGLIYEDSNKDDVWIFHIFGIDVFTFIATPILLLIAAAYCFHGYSRLRREAVKKDKRP